MQRIKINLSLRWYTVLLFLVEAGLVAFGIWALIDSIMIGSTVAGWKFLLLFLIWALPGMAVLLFFRSKSSESSQAATSQKPLHAVSQS